MMTNQRIKVSSGKLLLTLLLAVTHLLAGFSILLVSSWFIAACSVAGLGFNYMLPAVVIRALAIIRIASGYFSMLIGHSHLLDKLASIRLTTFFDLNDKVTVSREDSLDALHHQSEEVASIWMSWVGQNAGAFLSLLLLNVICLTLIPTLSIIVYAFSIFFFTVYALLLASMTYQSVELVAARKKLQFDIVKHIEAASLWHLYDNYALQQPSTDTLKLITNALQKNIRNASFLLLAGSMIALAGVFLFHSHALIGNALFIMLPVALLSINDWLTPTLSNQKQLLSYVEAKRATDQSNTKTGAVQNLDGEIKTITVSRFKAANTHMQPIDACFEKSSVNVVLGSSGAGKSRFLRALSGLLPFEGERKVTLDSWKIGEDITYSQGLLSDTVYLEQFPYVLSDTLAENLRIANPSASDNVLLETLYQVGLGHLNDLSQWLGEHGLPLSGGEKKRLGLARAILSDANVVLLDEPFESLDEENINRVTEIINDLASSKLIVLATHILPPNLAHQGCLRLDQVHNSGFSEVQYSEQA